MSAEGRFPERPLELGVERRGRGGTVLRQKLGHVQNVRSGKLKPITFVLNGKRTSVRVHPMKRLLDVLREDCHLTGTKEGCGEGECGACTVVVDGRAVNACLVPVAQVRRARVTTIEGLKGRHPLQRAFAEQGGAQCGICTPGMVMAAVALGPHPTLDEVRTGLAGNLCRCTGYVGIYRAISAAGGRLPERPLEPSRQRQSAKRAARARTVGANSATVRPATSPGKARFAGSRERGRGGTVVPETRGNSRGAGSNK